MKIINLPILLLFLFITSIVNASDINIVNLKVEYEETPLGIDVKKPRFSWQMQSLTNKKGCKQSAYRLKVIDETGLVVWDSKRVKAACSLNIKYNGKQLCNSTRYVWILDVWTNDNLKISQQSWFETGLMDSSISSWGGAKWIGGSKDDMVLFSHYLPVFKIEYNIQLDKASNSSKASFVFGANDERLMDSNKNIYQLESTLNESYFKLELDIAPLGRQKEAVINIYRVGYHPEDSKDNAFSTIMIPFKLINQTNKYEKHHIRLSNNLGHAQIDFDDQTIAHLGINPLGQGGDFIAFPVVGDVGFSVPSNNIVSFTDVVIKNFRSPESILARIKNQTILGGDEGRFVVQNPSNNSMPMLRTVFDADKEVKKARLYVTARGIYDFYINGKRISNEYFNPGSTQYNKTLMYQTYDVTSFIKSGNNAMGAILSEGWWSGASTYSGENWNFFGDRQSLLAKVVITYVDSSKKVIVTNPDKWQYFNDGPVIYGSFFQGEVYDANKEKQIESWSTYSYDSSKWDNAEEVSLNHSIAMEKEDFSDLKIIGQYGPTVKSIMKLTAKSMEEVRPGVFVYDLGQNMVGVPEIVLEGMKQGQKINFRFAEVKYPNLPEYEENVGMIMLENIRAAMAQDMYFAKGEGEEIYSPRFTFHGFRFIEITGIDKPLPIDNVKAVVLSSIGELSSHYETSNKNVNKLWENITWSTYGNFLSIPTDCPQRNERLGWSGDISVFAKSATYLTDVPQFLRRHLQAMRDTQAEDGRFMDVTPTGVGFGGILWGSAGVTVAWDSYLQYGDQSLIREHYPAMKKYIEYLQSKINPMTGILSEQDLDNWGSLGDWLSPEYDKSAKALLWESYFIHDLNIMSKVAKVLDVPADEQYFTQLCNERKEFYNSKYIEKSTGKTKFKDRLVDTQASYALALAFNIPNDSIKSKVVDNFVNTISRPNITDNGLKTSSYTLMTGFIGTSLINESLSECGFTDVAYKLLQQTEYPSWLYPVTQGATTVWERLNSYTHKDGFGGNNRMNSFNHYSFGAIASWMYSHSLGIERDLDKPGFNHFILQPEPDLTGEMTWAKGFYESMYGRIESAWEVNINGGYTYNFIIPANTTATVQIYSYSEEEFADDENFVNYYNGRAVFAVGSGVYTYSTQNR